MPDSSGTRKRKRDALTPHYCQIPGCGYYKLFQRHRIIPGRDGGKYRLGNVIALCPTHHAEADNGWISAEVLLEIVREWIRRFYGKASHNQADGTTEQPKSGWGDPSEESGEGAGDGQFDGPYGQSEDVG